MQVVLNFKHYTISHKTPTFLSELKIKIACTFHGLGPPACSDSELTSETNNPFRNFRRTPWMGDRPIARPPSTQERGHTSTPRTGFEPHDPRVRTVQ